MFSQLQAVIEKGLSVFDNPIIRTIFVTFVGLYAIMLAPRVTSGVKAIFDSTWFKALFFFLVVLLAHKDPRLALVVSLAFVLTLQGLAEASVQAKLKTVSKPSLPAVIPGPSAVVSPPAPPPVQQFEPDNVSEYDPEEESPPGFDGVSLGAQLM